MVMLLFSFWLCESRSVNKPPFFAIHFLMVMLLFSFWLCESRSVNGPPCCFVAHDGFPNLLSFIAIWCSLHPWSPHFGNNMHHGLGEFLSLRLCFLGCTGNQLLLTDLFDEFYFVQISFGIPARATGLLFAFNFWLSESRSVIPSFCIFSRGLVITPS